MFKAIACALALTASLPAAANDLVETSVIVRHDDLKLSSPAGMERLERRIHAAARTVCGASTSRELALGVAARNRACVTKAKAGAMAQVALLDRPRAPRA